ncbi:protein of unknown function [Methylocella tundrae]|uniref:Uncharacterized protein n=1 Tax=Methylocella tundrae TaxID=227605 RepID=A0A4U8Z1P8_METTU|nr:protein of unknown function [Methylocella tundrae]
MLRHAAGLSQPAARCLDAALIEGLARLVKLISLNFGAFHNALHLGCAAARKTLRHHRGDAEGPRSEKRRAGHYFIVRRRA